MRLSSNEHDNPVMWVERSARPRTDAPRRVADFLSACVLAGILTTACGQGNTPETLVGPTTVPGEPSLATSSSDTRASEPSSPDVAEPVGPMSTMGVTALGTTAPTCGGVSSPGNPYPCCSNGGNCTFYAWHSAMTNWRVSLPAWSHAHLWSNAAKNGGYVMNGTCAPGSIAVSRARNHVAWVTSCSGGVQVLEQNCGNYAGGVRAASYGAYFFEQGFIHQPTPVVKVTATGGGKTATNGGTLAVRRGTAVSLFSSGTAANATTGVRAWQWAVGPTGIPLPTNTVSTAASFTHTFSQPGQYVVILRATNGVATLGGSGVTGTGSLFVTVQ